MSSPELPSRAKPEALHEICKYLRGQGDTDKTHLYEELEIDRRQIRAAIDYGNKLGFIEFDSDMVSLGDRGRVISFNESLEENAVKEVFKDAIESYKPYRDALRWIHASDLIEIVSGNECVTQSAFKTGVRNSTGVEHSNREINLLIKTADAAGLGEFITGRKGLETRLKTTEELEEFMQRLIEDYGMPDFTEAEKDTEGVETEPGGEIGIVTGKGETGVMASANGIKLTVELDVNDKSEEEILEMIHEIRKMGSD